MLHLERGSRMPLYEQIYNYIKALIESGELAPGERLPSVRNWAGVNGVSKITVEQAYVQLAAEGYIKPHNRSPYEVLPLPKLQKAEETSLPSYKRKTEAPPLQYNFATGAMAKEAFDYARWKRMLGYVLRTPELLLSRGAVEGEWELRQTLAAYVREARGVKASPEQIVVGIGTQSLLHIISSLLRKDVKHLAMGMPVYPGGREIFEEAGFYLSFVSQCEENLAHNLKKSKVDALYCTPSHSNAQGDVLSAGQRRRLLEWATKERKYIIEDDYDSELRYYGRPISSLQGFDRQGRVIYVGSVSKVLPPSIRLSYMVLPPALCYDYEKRRDRYGQSGSVLEQLALAEYMRRGDWGRQIRRLRKYYAEKSQRMKALLQQYFGERVVVEAPIGGVYMAIYLKTEAPRERLQELARSAGCAINMVEPDEVRFGCQGFLLSFSAIPRNELEKAVSTLAQAWKGI